MSSSNWIEQTSRAHSTSILYNTIYALIAPCVCRGQTIFLKFLKEVKILKKETLNILKMNNFNFYQPRKWRN